MLRLSLKTMLANKLRVLLTSLAVVLGVGFVVASFVLSDGLTDSFGELSREIYEGTDLTIEPVDNFGAEPMTTETLDTVLAEPGVRLAAGGIGDDGIQPVRADGTILESFGPPMIGSTHIVDPDLSPVTLVEGTAPSPGTFAMDVDTAADEGFVIGERYDVVTSAATTNLELSGLLRFGADNSTNGAVLTTYHNDDLYDMLGRDQGTLDEITISVNDDYAASDVEAALTAALGDNVRVANQQSLEDEQAAEFNEAIGILRNILLGFAGVSLFVSTFIIYNTFGMVLAQRVREIGLLRAIGTEGRQVRRSVLLEAMGVGLLASAVGIGVGVALTALLRRVFDLLGAGLPPAPTILAPRTILLALVLGVGVTVVSSIAPARRAAKVSPIAALTGADERGEELGRVRTAIGAALMLVGLVAGGFGLAGAGGTTITVALLASGAGLVFIGTAVTSPAIASPVIGAVAWPVSKLLGVSGRLARQNARRHPRRTATTAAALMIGLSLVTTAMIVGDSVKTAIGSTLETAVDADYLVAHQDFRAVPAVVAEDFGDIDEVGAFAAVSAIDMQINDDIDDNQVTDLATITSLFALDFNPDTTDAALLDGSALAPNRIPDNAVIMPTDWAEEQGYAVGDQIDVMFENGADAMFEVYATYGNVTVLDGTYFQRSGVEAVTEVDEVFWIAAEVADGYTAAEAESAIGGFADQWPQLDVQSSAQYRESIEAEIDGLLMVVNALLALAISIALVGIGLTLALGVVERTRELGLLRAVGMTRRQMRRMVRWEAATIALFGAILGAGLGGLFGWSAVQALPDSFVTAVTFPVTRIILMVLLSAVAGLFAAIIPAYRAGRLNVLDAIAA